MGPNRREFLWRGAALGAGAFMIGAARGSHAQTAPLKAGLIGCGRRGVGAVKNLLDADPAVVLTAICDVFPDTLAEGRKKIERYGERVQLDDSVCFHGFDGHEKVIASGVDLVLICTPPGFHPAQFAAAVAAGKHVFMEKPAAVDPAGVRSIIATAEIAAQKGLSVVAGTQRRHQVHYRDLIPRIHDGAIGDLVAAECYWIGDYGYYPAVHRKDGWSDMEAQIRNWNYHAWLSGDHIVEQHVHNIDIMNWAFQANPIKAVGVGGRQQRTGPEFGHIYDHFSVELEYPGGVRVQSICRQNKDTYSRVGERLVGTKGTCDPRRGITGENAYTWAGEESDPYIDEHRHLVAAIRSGTPINEGRQLAESSMAAIIGRMACYTGQEVTWDFAMNESKLDLHPKELKLGPLPEAEIAVPGVTPLI